ncbi:uncharacterized protein LOC106661490 isoform X2 [Cimex lectularius]|uniref:Uncharacterized protein n=1 Tax=Cimex lectularius TaxID=79782 RepID=A0A8I6RDH5_CIMLE|nr:uncharacterized protein LOC106661490 isoform X2 [Cimex lectularius]
MQNDMLMMDICESNSGKVSAASHYALQIAFKSLKNRCDKLQYQMIDLLKENHRLKSEKGFLADKVDELERQKCELNHYILNHRDAIEEEYLSEKLQDPNGETGILKSKLNQVEGENYDENDKNRIDNLENNEDLDTITPEDDDDVSILTIEDVESTDGNDYIEGDIATILNRLKYEKFMLQQFQDSIATALREISSKMTERNSICNQKGANYNDLSFNSYHNSRNQADRCNNAENMVENEYSLNKSTLCPVCKNPIFSDVEEIRSDLLLDSFEIITCKCNF